MYSTFYVQYLTNEQGLKTAVQIPYNDWNKLLKDYTKLKQMFELKNELKNGFIDLRAVEEGKSEEISLSTFLDKY